MQYIRLSTVLVVLTVVLAGCSGGAPAGDDATPSATTGGSDGQSVPTGEDFSLREADERLRDAGSFTTSWSYAVVDPDGTETTITDTYRVDLDANRSLELFETTAQSGQTDFEIFITDERTYTRYGGGEDAFYQVSDSSQSVFDSATGRASGFYTYIEEDAQFAGTESFDGVTVSRYEYTDVEGWQEYNQGATAMTFDTDEEITITDFSISVLVDSNNLARLTTWTLTGETESGDTVSVEWRYSVTDIGETTVDDPDWLAEAQSQT